MTDLEPQAIKKTPNEAGEAFEKAEAAESQTAAATSSSPMDESVKGQEKTSGKRKRARTKWIPLELWPKEHAQPAGIIKVIEERGEAFDQTKAAIPDRSGRAKAAETPDLANEAVQVREKKGKGLKRRRIRAQKEIPTDFRLKGRFWSAEVEQSLQSDKARQRPQNPGFEMYVASHGWFYGDVVIQEFESAVIYAHAASKKQPAAEFMDTCLFWTDGSVSSPCPLTKATFAGASVVFEASGPDACRESLGICLTKTTHDSTSAELEAIKAALETAATAAQNRGPCNPEQRMILFTDSQLALKAIADIPETSRMSGELARAFTEASWLLRQYGIHLELHWVPSHCQIPGNERADKVANMARKYASRLSSISSDQSMFPTQL